MKILLAEDTRDLSRAEVAILQHEGYEVDPVYDGEEALKHINENVYDGMILDIMMPKKDGLEVLKEIRSRGLNTPVLLLTAKAEIDDRVTGLDMGADDYLTKPFAMKELLARVRTMLRKHADYTVRELTVADVTLHSESLEMVCQNSIRLSIREYELMEILMRNPDRELTTELLISKVWATEPEADADTVWLYISYLRRKLASISSKVEIAGERNGSYRLIV